MTKKRPAKPARGNLPCALGIVVGGARVDLHGRELDGRLPEIAIVDGQIRQAEKLQSCGTIALAVRGLGAVEVADPDIQDELRAALIHVRRKRVKERIVESMRQVCLELFELHWGDVFG